MENNINKDNQVKKENQVMNDVKQPKVEKIDYKTMFEEARDALNHLKEMSKMKEQAQKDIIESKKLELEMTKNNPTYLKYLEHSKDEGHVENEINRLDKIINKDRDQSANNK